MNCKSISSLLRSPPEAFAVITGNGKNRHLSGTVKFFPWAEGSIVCVELVNLPKSGSPFGFHIHEGDSCCCNFEKTGGHYNPSGAQHPAHAGDLPVIFSNNGYSYSVFYTDRFVPEEVIGRTVVIHEKPDDFRTQPAGDSGGKMGCGEIAAYR
jgi:Cu-Zn family superoxide dismutase